MTEQFATASQMQRPSCRLPSACRFLVCVGVFLPIVLLSTEPKPFDTLETKNGNRLRGRIKLIQDGKIAFRTDDLGELRIPLKDIARITIKRPLTFAVNIKSKKRITGMVNYRQKAFFVDRGNGIEEQIPEFAAAWADGVADPFARTWEHEIGVDISGKSGNTTESAIGISAQSVLEGAMDRLKFRAKYERETKDDSKSEDNSQLEADGERRISERTSIYTRCQFERDRIEGVMLRQIYALGCGYYILNETNHRLRTRLGVQYRNERYESGVEEGNLGLDMGIFYLLRNDTLGRLESELTYSPVLDSDIGRYVLHFEAHWDLPVSSKHWVLRTGIECDYDDDPQPDKQSTDFSYFIRVVYSW